MNKPKYLSPLKSIKLYCFECAGGSAKERKDCSLLDCPLYPYRLGHNPKLKGVRRKNAFCTVKIGEKQGIQSITRRPIGQRRQSKGDRQGDVGLSPSLTLDGQGD
jgi:hypothetical protein